MNGSVTSGFSARLCFNLVSITLIALAIYLGRGVLTPIFLSILLALIMSPITDFLLKKDMHRVLAIMVPLALSLVLILSIMYFLSFQIGLFFNDIPALEKRFNELILLLQHWVTDTFNIALWQQERMLSETAQKMKDSGPVVLQKTFSTVTEMISYLVLFPVYTFLLIYHKVTIKKFLIEAFSRSEEDRVRDILQESQTIILQYVIGLLIEVSIVFSLNAAGFLLFGIKYPIFLALVGALLNIVPWIGMLVANIFAILVTMVSSEQISDVFVVAGVFAGVQIIDNNILMPLIVGNKIRINALAIITGVMVGGALAGVPGMFLALPGIALMKVIFERVDSLKPWATLLSDETVLTDVKRARLKKAVSKLRRKKAAPS